MPIKVTMFRCRFCKKVYAREWNCKWHETHRCTRNPIQHACMTCEHFHGIDGYWAESEYIDSKTTCTNHSCPFQYDCDNWDERTANWKYWIQKPVSEISAEVVDLPELPF